MFSNIPLDLNSSDLEVIERIQKSINNLKIKNDLLIKQIEERVSSQALNLLVKLEKNLSQVENSWRENMIRELNKRFRELVFKYPEHSLRIKTFFEKLSIDYIL